MGRLVYLTEEQAEALRELRDETGDTAILVMPEMKDKVQSLVEERVPGFSGDLSELDGVNCEFGTDSDLIFDVVSSDSHYLVSELK